MAHWSWTIYDDIGEVIVLNYGTAKEIIRELNRRTEK